MDPSERYVPDTGTALQRVLAAAEEHEATLLLDEAEALAGRRTEVRDAHDRYAAAEPGPDLLGALDPRERTGAEDPTG